MNIPATLPVEAWGAINTLGLVILGLIALWNNRKVAEVKKIVDGPLSVALKSNADLTSRLAEASGKHDDITAAVKAQAISDNREEGKALTASIPAAPSVPLKLKIAIVLLLSKLTGHSAEPTNALVQVEAVIQTRQTNAPIYVATIPDTEPCPICHGPSHHEIQLVRLISFDVIKQVTVAHGQRQTNTVFTSQPTSALATNFVAKVRSQPGWQTPPPLPNGKDVSSNLFLNGASTR